MNERVLITGGAGFVGSHLADELARHGYAVTVFDALDPQVHGDSGRPAYLDPAHELVRGDVRDTNALRALVRRADVVYHLAARVGVGQSMYEIRDYTEVNAVGAASLLQALVDTPHSVRHLVVASSMSIYGEGLYACARHGRIAPAPRPAAQLARREWEVRCPTCDGALEPLATPESKPLAPASVYAVSKRDQEELFLSFGRAYRIPVAALRFFNIYGSRQALGNPYTGVAAIFCGRILAGQRPVIYEDGLQRRDFVHVSDVVRACRLALAAEAAGEVFNVGSGEPITVREIAEALAAELAWRGGYEVSGRFRAGDIRHCYADVTRIGERLGYEPRVRFADGVRELIDWVARQRVDTQRDVTADLAARGLVRG